MPKAARETYRPVMIPGWLYDELRNARQNAIQPMPTPTTTPTPRCGEVGITLSLDEEERLIFSCAGQHCPDGGTCESSFTPMQGGVRLVCQCVGLAPRRSRRKAATAEDKQPSG